MFFLLCEIICCRNRIIKYRLKRLLALAGNPHVSAAANASIARCNCGHVCPVQRKQVMDYAYEAWNSVTQGFLIFYVHNYCIFVYSP